MLRLYRGQTEPQVIFIQFNGARKVAKPYKYMTQSTMLNQAKHRDSTHCALNIRPRPKENTSQSSLTLKEKKKPTGSVVIRVRARGG